MEGPSLVILKEEVQPFVGKKILSATGNAKFGIERIQNLKVVDFKTWGKHFLICFPKFYLRVHFLMFGSYRVNETKEQAPRLALLFKNGELNLYNCAIRLEEGNPDDVYDYEVDVMSPTWNATKALKASKAKPDALVCDLLLDQNIFAGSGNIIKNEALFRQRVHPESRVGALKPKRLKGLIDETRNYSLEFYELKKIYQLSKHWQVFKKRKCTNCGGPVEQRKTGKLMRRNFTCYNCQQLFV